MAKAMRKLGFFILVALLFAGCATTQPPAPVDNRGALRVGITPDYPPMIFKQGDRITGAEADFALRLAEGLGKTVQFVELRWDQQISALMEGKTDLIMSGMTITDARKARIDFTDPYLKSGLFTLMRSEDAPQFNSLQAIRESYSTVGVVAGTTGETFVRKNFPDALGVVAFPKASDAVYLLKNMRIDMMVHDGPSIAWLVSENEGTLKGFWEPFNQEWMGWGVRRSDQELLNQVNALLRNWKKDGTLKEVLSKWLPYLKDFE
jgi:ABC-type amino acid transport substrate-binding protein